jgi:hypothetical protein
MPDPAPPAYLERLLALERDVRELKARVAELQKLLGQRPEHPVDRTLTRDKTVYDWQGPR